VRYVFWTETTERAFIVNAEEKKKKKQKTMSGRLDMLILPGKNKTTTTIFEPI
jgi:hypothetical protein